ncbi:AAA family ATPase [Gordonia alkanivorans]|uniref:McrB family protein n=2 Tax=Gordonia TaxID=2053 RepID=UPI00244BAEF3|nr:AAA family ATPase [Gordonia alkanivorans]MDH3048446.1 AAA family ATPase [Gordonia alkanivorans]
MEIDGDPNRFEQVAAWWADERPIFADEVLCDRARLRDGAKERDDDPEWYRPNARAMVAVAQHIGSVLQGPVNDAAGRKLSKLRTRTPDVMWDATWPRGDLWVDWRVPKTYGLGIRLWLNGYGLGVGLRPYPDGESGATERAIAAIESRPLPGYEFLAGGRSKAGRDVGFIGGGSGEVFYGRWFDREAVAGLDLRAEILRTASQVAPLFGLFTDVSEPSTVPKSDPTPLEPVVPDDPFADLADELLVERAFLDDVVALLEDKKQVVFYGPPGTGKTYFARKLAEALVAEPERRPVVQFHPSTSYEDFFEGYRPETNANGVMTYSLVRGPLAELAENAHTEPDRRHVMIIDEINRANLPKVLGELLFLFEYRNTPVRTLYRSTPFELSENVWFIGTMNTADRSIALVDAALRRRFHFIPFFPNHGPMAGLLDRWLDREAEPAWVGEIVAQVNDELEKELGGPHLQLGPSHFMKHGLDRESMRRIWEYDIEPFIEDQFFGDPTRIDRFRFESVWARFAEVAAESITADAEAPSADTADPVAEN